MASRWVRFGVVPLVVAAVAVPLVAVVLILTQPPQAVVAPSGQGLDFGGLAAWHQVPPLQSYVARDGTTLAYRHYGSAGAGAPRPLLVMVHGSGWHGLQYHGLATRVAQAGMAEVLVPDLRGHGVNPSRRGDVAYVGQLEDDLADLVQTRRQPGQPVVFLGHSSGGGLVVRFAGGPHGALLDGAILLAPFLQHDAPTTRAQSGGWAHPLIRRIIGQTVLHQLGVRAFDGLTAVQFAFPQAILDGPLGHTATSAYSYRMMVSFAPRRHYAADVAQLPPFLLVAGARDEAFVAEAYAPLMQASSTRGTYQIVPGIGHLAVVDHEATWQAIQTWWRDHALTGPAAAVASPPLP